LEDSLAFAQMIRFAILLRRHVHYVPDPKSIVAGGEKGLAISGGADGKPMGFLQRKLMGVFSS